jgi:short-subunit dehydrogenase
MYDMNNKVVVITGASSGIGRALAANALQRGARVACCARNMEALTAIFGTGNDHVFLYKADVSHEDDCSAFIGAVLQHWGRIDVMIPNAGISMRAMFQDTDLKVLKELMDVNFWGAVYCIKYALPEVLKNKGVIVGISSIAGYRGLPCRTGYSASKFALQGYLEALRTELLHTGVHVMWVSPGFTASNIRNTARGSDGSFQKETPLDEKKLMTAEDCAGFILDGITAKKRTVVLTSEGKLAVWLNKLLPALADKMIYKRFLNEPDSPLKKYQ